MVHHEYTDHTEGYMSGGAGSMSAFSCWKYKISSQSYHFLYFFIKKGYVLSKEALNRFVNMGLTGNISSRGVCNHKQNNGNEDVEIGLCLNSTGVTPVDTRDEKGRHRFLPHTPWRWKNSDNFSALAKSYQFYPVHKVSIWLINIFNS